MSTVAQDVQQIREAIYGRDVREAIADGIEHCYSDVSGGITTANTAADAAYAAAQRANTAAAGAEGIPGTASLEDVNELKNAFSDLAKLNYEANINELNKIVPFHANAGDSITIKTADGSEFTADSKICFLDANMNQIPNDKGVWWLGSGRNSRTVSPIVEYFFAYTFDGQSQAIIVKNNSSDYNFKKADGEIRNGFLLSSGEEHFVTIDLSTVSFEFGGLNSTSGTEYSSNNVIRSKKIDATFAKKCFVNFQADGNFGLWKIFKYDADGKYLASSAYNNNRVCEENLPEKIAYLRLSVEYWDQQFSDLSPAQWFKGLQLLYPASGSFGLTKSVDGASFINLFENVVNKKIEFAYSVYQKGQNYVDKELAAVQLSPNTRYTFICGAFSENTYLPKMRVYILYEDSSVDRIDVDANAPFNSFVTKNKAINYAKIFAISVFGIVTESAGICYYTNIALLEGYPKIRFGVNESDAQIPTYYESSLAAKETRIRTMGKDCSFSGDSFVFLTDTHFTEDFAATGDESSRIYNANHSIPLIRHILDNTSVRMLCFGGDLVNSTNSIDAMMRSISRFDSSFPKDKTRVVYCVGNHEYYTDLGQETPDRPTAEWLYGAGVKYNEYQLIGKHESGTYFFDNAIQKTRYFIIPCDRDTGTTVSQSEWILNKLTETPAGYHIICIGHAFMLDNMSGFRGYYANIIEGLEAVKSKSQYAWNGHTYDYSALDNVKVVCVITGHVHIDGHLLSTGGVLCISTTCDSWEQNYVLQNGSPVKSSRTLNSVDEQAFDVFQFDFDNKKIYCTRIGYGSDREFTYT